MRGRHTPLVSYSPGAERLAPTAAINNVVTPSHWITAINERVDAATREELQAEVTWILCWPYAFLPAEKFRDRC